MEFEWDESKAAETVMEDELRPEYELENLRVRKVGPGRQHFDGLTVRLEADVAAMFPDAQAVNEALRFLIRVTRRTIDTGCRAWVPP